MRSQGPGGGVGATIIGNLGVDGGGSDGGPVHKSRNGCLTTGNKRVVSGGKINGTLGSAHGDDLGTPADDQGARIGGIQCAGSTGGDLFPADDRARFNGQNRGGLDEGEVVEDVDRVRGPPLVAGDHGDATGQGTAVLGYVPRDVVDVLEVDCLGGSDRKADPGEQTEEFFVHGFGFLRGLRGVEIP